MATRPNVQYIKYLYPVWKCVICITCSKYMIMYSDSDKTHYYVKIYKMHYFALTYNIFLLILA